MDFTIRGDYFKVQQQRGMLIAYGIGSQYLLHWGLKWSFLYYTLHYSGAESTYYSGRSLDSAASPPLLASLCSLMRTCHQLQSSQLFMEAVVSLPIMGTVGVGSAFWVLHKVFLPACAVLSQRRAPSLCILGLMGIHAQCQILQLLPKKHHCALGTHLAPAKE